MSDMGVPGINPNIKKEGFDWRTPVIVLSLIVTLMSLLGYFLRPWWWSPDPQPNMIIEEEDVAAWIPINNTFAREDMENTENGWHYWTGILIHLGTYKVPPGNPDVDRQFDSVWLRKAANKQWVELKKGTFTWLNIVSENVGKGEPMLVKDHPFYLYPNKYHRERGSCAQLVACAEDGTHCLCPSAGPACPPSDRAPVDLDCLRAGRIHGDLDPAAFATYWQGRNGYKMQSAGGKGKGGDHAWYRFRLRDRFRVEVYTAVDDGSGNLVMQPDTANTYGLGVIDEIHFRSPGGPPTGDDHQEPTWPLPK